MRCQENLTRIAFLGTALLSCSPESRAQESSWKRDRAREAYSSEVTINLESSRLRYHNRSPYYASCLLSGESARGGASLVDLVLTVCELDNATSCRTEHLYLENPGSLVQCMLSAPPEIAKWSERHPGMKVVRWTCVETDPEI